MEKDRLKLLLNPVSLDEQSKRHWRADTNSFLKSQIDQKSKELEDTKEKIKVLTFQKKVEQLMLTQNEQGKNLGLDDIKDHQKLGSHLAEYLGVEEDKIEMTPSILLENSRQIYEIDNGDESSKEYQPKIDSLETKKNKLIVEKDRLIDRKNKPEKKNNERVKDELIESGKHFQEIKTQSQSVIESLGEVLKTAQTEKDKKEINEAIQRLNNDQQEVNDLLTSQKTKPPEAVKIVTDSDGNTEISHKLIPFFSLEKLKELVGKENDKGVKKKINARIREVANERRDSNKKAEFFFSIWKN